MRDGHPRCGGARRGRAGEALEQSAAGPWVAPATTSNRDKQQAAEFVDRGRKWSRALGGAIYHRWRRRRRRHRPLPPALIILPQQQPHPRHLQVAILVHHGYLLVGVSCSRAERQRRQEQAAQLLAGTGTVAAVAVGMGVVGYGVLNLGGEHTLVSQLALSWACQADPTWSTLMHCKLLLLGRVRFDSCSLLLPPAHCCRLFVADAGWIKDRQEDHASCSLPIEEQYVSTRQTQHSNARTSGPLMCSGMAVASFWCSN